MAEKRYIGSFGLYIPVVLAEVFLLWLPKFCSVVKKYE